MSRLDAAALDLRLRLGANAVFSIEEAALLLPVPPDLGRLWIETHVKQTIIAGVPSVLWADVLRAVEAAEAARGGDTPADTREVSGDTSGDVSPDVSQVRWLSTQEAAELLGVNRKTLDALARKNLDVPGGPVVVGGRKRIHLRWPAAGLELWLAAVRARPDTPSTKPVRRRPTPRRPQGEEDGPTDWAQVRRRLLDR